MDTYEVSDYADAITEIGQAFTRVSHVQDDETLNRAVADVKNRLITAARALDDLFEYLEDKEIEEI